MLFPIVKMAEKNAEVYPLTLSFTLYTSQHESPHVIICVFQQKISKQNQTWGGSTTVKKQVSGTASSVAFTPLQVC